MSVEDKNNNLNNSEREVIADSRNTGPDGSGGMLSRDTRRDEKYDIGLDFNYDSDVADKRARMKNASGKGVRPVTTYIAPDEEDTLLDFFAPPDEKEEFLVRLISEANERTDTIQIEKPEPEEEKDKKVTLEELFPPEETVPDENRVTVHTIELDMPPELLEPHKPSLDETIQFRMDADVVPSIFERAQQPETDDVLRMIEENADPYESVNKESKGLRKTAELDLSGVVRTKGLGISNDAEGISEEPEDTEKPEDQETETAAVVVKESYGLQGDPLAELNAAPEEPENESGPDFDIRAALAGLAGKIKGYFAPPSISGDYGSEPEDEEPAEEIFSEEEPSEEVSAEEIPAEETPAEDTDIEEVNAEEESAQEEGLAENAEAPENEQTLEEMVIADSSYARKMLVMSGALAAAQGKSTRKVSAGSSSKNKKTGGKTAARKKAVTKAKESDASKAKSKAAAAGGAAGSGASGGGGNKGKPKNDKKNKPKNDKNNNPKNDSKSKPAEKPETKTPAKEEQGTQLQEKDFKKVKPKKKRKKRNKFLAFFGTLFAMMILFGFVAGIIGVAYVGYTVSQAPTIQPKSIYDTLDTTTYIYDDKNKLVDEIYYSENRQITTYEELPDNLINAFVAVEDKTFWSHKGFNFRRIIGAVVEKFHGGLISGTSTITQQLARNVFLPEEKSERSIKRKITEMYYAYEIEEELSKEEIITAYLNTIYLGYGCYGVDIAAKTYFNRSVEDLTLEQCAALAALPQAPGTYALLTTEEDENTTKLKDGLYANDVSKERRDMILGLMQEQGYITEEERVAATKPLTDFIEPGKKHEAASKSAFKDYLLETVRKDLMSTYELTEEQADKLIYARGLRIYSTLDSQAQKTINKQFAKDENFPTTVKSGVKPEAAMVIVEVGTGQVKAMVGGRKETGKMLFNRATNPRQPGSSIKPLTVYSSALQMSYELQKAGKKFTYVNTGYDKQGTSGWGNYITTTSSVIDEKMTVKGKTWPQNATKSYSGKNTFRTAMYKSINTCAVKILSQVGIEYSMDMLHKYGITTAIDDTSEPVNDYNLAALGLGAMSLGVTPLDMAVAYTVFPNGGVKYSPICYTRVEDSNGKVILEGKAEKKRVLNEGVAWIMTNVLEGDVKYGIAGNARISGTPVAGKTGTTNDQYDIWFDGFTPKYAAALWIGTDKNIEMNSMSEKAAALWSNIMSRVDRAEGGSFRERPDNVIYWYGDYYTRGTQPPAPKPKAKKSDKKDDKKSDTSEKKP